MVRVCAAPPCWECTLRAGSGHVERAGQLVSVQKEEQHVTTSLGLWCVCAGVWARPCVLVVCVCRCVCMAVCAGGLRARPCVLRWVLLYLYVLTCCLPTVHLQASCGEGPAVTVFE